MRRSPRPMRITDAAPSQAEQLRYREVRYVVMMTVRALCLIAATVLVTAHVPGLVIWVPILVVLALVLPWLAVILANDRAPRERYRLAGKLAHTPPPQRALTAPEASETTPRVIEHDE